MLQFENFPCFPHPKYLHSRLGGMNHIQSDTNPSWSGWCPPAHPTNPIGKSEYLCFNNKPERDTARPGYMNERSVSQWGLRSLFVTFNCIVSHYQSLASSFISQGSGRGELMSKHSWGAKPHFDESRVCLSALEFPTPAVLVHLSQPGESGLAAAARYEAALQSVKLWKHPACFTSSPRSSSKGSLSSQLTDRAADSLAENMRKSGTHKRATPTPLWLTQSHLNSKVNRSLYLPLKYRSVPESGLQPLPTRATWRMYPTVCMRVCAPLSNVLTSPREWERSRVFMWLF